MPAPSNDNFASAIALSTTLPANTSGTTVEATQESGEDNSPPYFGGTYTSQSVWYTFTPTSTGRYRFTCTPDPAVVDVNVHKRIAIDLSTASAVNAITVLMYDKFDGTGSEETFWTCTVEADLTASTTYRIRISSQNFSGDVADQRSVAFELDWEKLTVPSAPSNDNMSGAYDLGTDPADGLKHSGTTSGATGEAAFEGTAGDWPATWYKFETGGSGAGAQEIHVAAPDMTVYRPYWELYRVTTDPPTAWAHLSFVDSGDINDPFPHAIEDNWDALASPTLLNSTKYRILASTWDFNGTTGDYELHFGPYVPTPPPSAPDNDTPVFVNGDDTHLYNLGISRWNDNDQTDAEGAFAAGTTELATAQAGEPSKAGFAATRSVWYRMHVPTADDYKVWVESSVDCVLALYEHDGSGADWHGVTFGPTTEVYSDDDSGPGNQPELTINNTDIDPELEGYNYWVAVDSKTEGEFTLHMERVRTGTPVANDLFEDAEVIASIPATINGTTVGAWAESRETDSEWIGTGPVATVWYKYVAIQDGILQIRGTCNTNNDDAYIYVDVFKGDVATADLLERFTPDLIGSKGYFGYFDTTAELKEQVLVFNVVNGETYYIRVQTETHSEDFTIYLENASIYIDIQPSGVDIGPYNDAATVYIDIQPSGTESQHGTILDAATVLIDVQPSGVEFMAIQYTDTAVVPYNIQVDSHDCMTSWEPSQLVARIFDRFDGTANMRWVGTAVYDRFTVVAGDGLEEC